jgi:predicted CXXCH cytochrome family protein
MRLRPKGILVALLGALLLTVASQAFPQDAFHLKPGAKGKICLTCHVAFQETMKLPYVHTPVKSGDCSDCHNPHASSHGKLLSEDPNRICFSCHDGIVPEKAKSSHKVAVEGNCVACHDPHASKNRYNLRASGNALCFGCHTEFAKTVAGNRFKHNPVEKGCLNCHDPHASSEADFLLATGVPALCLRCHKAKQPSFAKAHMGYPVERGRCDTCHDPHGSSNKGILWADVHRPVASRMCNQCHQDATSPEPFSTRKPGFELCRGCHNDLLNETFFRNRVHWPVVDKVACLNCHTPHASRQSALLKRPLLSLCGNCHRDTIRRQETSLTKHKPIQEGKCMSCHMPHSSNNVFLLDNTSLVNLCGTCHEWQKHSTHPIGEKVIDKRNSNLSVDCSSCHRAHGSEFKNFAQYDLKRDLCVQCHEQYKR